MGGYGDALHTASQSTSIDSWGTSMHCLRQAVHILAGCTRFQQRCVITMYHISSVEKLNAIVVWSYSMWVKLWCHWGAVIFCECPKLWLTCWMSPLTLEVEALRRLSKRSHVKMKFERKHWEISGERQNFKHFCKLHSTLWFLPKAELPKSTSNWNCYGHKTRWPTSFKAYLLICLIFHLLTSVSCSHNNNTEATYIVKSEQIQGESKLYVISHPRLQNKMHLLLAILS